MEWVDQMRAAIDLLSLRSFARAFALLGVGLVAANCSPDVERFNDDPFATNTPRPPSETTGSVSGGQVQSHPLAELPPAEPLATKPGSKLLPGEKPTPAPAPMLPAQAARKPVKWLPAPSEGTPSPPPDFLTNKQEMPPVPAAN